MEKLKAAFVALVFGLMVFAFVVQLPKWADIVIMQQEQIVQATMQ